MNYAVKSGDPAKQRTACIVAGVHEKRILTPAGESLDAASGGFLKKILRRGDIEGRPGQSLMLYDVPGISAHRVLLVGLGPQGEFDRKGYRDAWTATARVLKESGCGEAVSTLAAAAPGVMGVAEAHRDAVLVIEEVLYRFDQCKSEAGPAPGPLKRITLLTESAAQAEEASTAVTQGAAIAKGVKVAKDLGNLPGNICTPTYLAGQARALGRRSARLRVEILDERRMKTLGMGALLSVARGSVQPAKLIVMEYRGGKAREKPVVFVGKGLTFDAGGISIKPAAAMDEMKYDMCGGASVFGAMTACLELQLPINFVAIVPASENLPDGDANKPGDIVTSLSGQTIEVLNTDAEGRLILCDALSYAERFKPAAVIDIATLTGACVVALGAHASGLMSNDDALAGEIIGAGTESGDRAWRLPLWKEYGEQLKSNFADVANIGGREGGAITAGAFLSRFTKKFTWAHLDIAGTAWKSGAEKGATGRPVPLLSQFLIRWAARDSHAS